MLSLLLLSLITPYLAVGLGQTYSSDWVKRSGGENNPNNNWVNSLFGGNQGEGSNNARDQNNQNFGNNQWGQGNQNFGNNQWGMNQWDPNNPQTWNQHVNMDDLTARTQGMSLRIQIGGHSGHEAEPSGAQSARFGGQNIDQAGPSGSMTSRPRRRSRNAQQQQQLEQQQLQQLQQGWVPPSQRQDPPPPPPNHPNERARVRNEAIQTRLLMEFQRAAIPYYSFEFEYACTRITRSNGQPLTLPIWQIRLARQSETALEIRDDYLQRALTPWKVVARSYLFRQPEPIPQRRVRFENQKYNYVKAYLIAFYDWEINTEWYELLLAQEQIDARILEAVAHFDHIKDVKWTDFDFTVDDGL